MLAGFAKNLEAEEIEQGAHDIFVRSRSFRRPTWPRYALLDHKAFDRALADQYGRDCRIEDCWRPFAAVATNLSTHNLELIRSGLMWEAVRASSAIPGLLPPFYTRDGNMLVDGCLIDNVPLAPMHELKTGPNLVVHFGEPAAEMFDVAYDALPGRLELFAAMLMPFAGNFFRPHRVRSTYCGGASWRISVMMPCRRRRSIWSCGHPGRSGLR